MPAWASAQAAASPAIFGADCLKQLLDNQANPRGLVDSMRDGYI